MTAGRADRLRTSLRLYLVADSGLVPGQHLPGAVASALRGGVTAVQLRAKSATMIELLELARTLQAMCTEAGVPFVLNDRVDVALAAEVDGVHVGHADADEDSPQEARHLLGPGAIVGVAVSSAHEARLAAAHGASYVSTGPMFPPASSKLVPGTQTGEALLRSVRAATGLPLVVVGGITADRAAALYAAGADGLCVGAAILRSPDIESAARAFVTAGASTT